MLDLEWESCICCASTLSSCLRSCLPHLTMVLLWIKEYQVSYRPDCCPKSGSPGGPPLFSITVAVVLTASAVQSHYLYVNLLEYFLPGKGVFKAQCCCYDLSDLSDFLQWSHLSDSRILLFIPQVLSTLPPPTSPCQISFPGSKSCVNLGFAFVKNQNSAKSPS